MKLAACFLAVAAGMCTAVLADEPQAPAPQPPAAQAPATSASANVGDAKTAPAATPAAKPDKSEVVNVAATEAEIKQMRSRGYKPVNRKGTLVFCRDEGELGTHFQRTRCSTMDQLKQAELSGKDFTNQIQQQGSATPFKGDMPPSGHP